MEQSIVILVCVNIIPILQVGEMRLREARLSAQGYTAEKPRLRIQVSLYLCMSEYEEWDMKGVMIT